MYRHRAPVRDLEELTVEQRLILGGVAVVIPLLIEAIKEGTTTASYKLGSRRLEDGRRLELELVAQVPEGKWHSIAKSWGQIPPRSPKDHEA